MVKLGLAPIVLHLKERRGLPTVGQRVQVSVRNEIELWQGSQRVQYQVGEVYLGTVTVVDDDHLFDLRTDSGALHRIYARETAFEIEPVTDSR
ncbi:MAG: hypothetical protein WCP31_01430 [Chloroflexales bacterium]